MISETTLIQSKKSDDSMVSKELNEIKSRIDSLAQSITQIKQQENDT